MDHLKSILLVSLCFVLTSFGYEDTMFISVGLKRLFREPIREKQQFGFVTPYADLLQVYNTYTRRQDLRPDLLNECAIRMSIALSVSGFSFDEFPDQSRVFRGHKTGIPVAHVLGANELAQYLWDAWGPPEIYTIDKINKAASGVSTRPGVIYFNDCFTREGEAGRWGDHIDIWTGYEYYNQVLSLAAGLEDKTSIGNLFNRSNEIWFWELK